jgi:hypothetical protein
MLRASFPPVHGGGRDTNLVVTVSQLSPHSVQLQRMAQEPRGFVFFSKLTQLTTIYIEQALKQSNEPKPLAKHLR